MENNKDYSFTVSVSKDAYHNKEETKAALLAEEAGKEARKKLDIKRKLSFKTIECSSQQLLEYALDGYTFCTVHDDFPKNDPYHKKFYTYTDGYYTMTAKSSQFFKESHFIGVDIDETNYKTPQDLIDRLSLQPTFWYTSLSNMKTIDETGEYLGARFRLIYVFDSPICGKYFFRYCSWQLHSIIEEDTHEVIHDKCGMKCDQYFNGTNWDDTDLNVDYNISNNIYSLEDIDVTKEGYKDFLENHCYYSSKDNYQEIDNIKCILFSSTNIEQHSSHLSQLNKLSEKSIQYNSKDISINQRLIKDAKNLSFDDFHSKYKNRFSLVYRTEKQEWLTFHDEELGDIKYQECDEDFLELKWLCAMNKSKELVKVTDGHHRRSTLFNRCWLRRLIKPSITADEMFYNLVIDRERYFDNSDNVLTIECLVSKVKQAYQLSPEESIEKYLDIYEDTKAYSSKKKIIIHWTSRKKIHPISLEKEIRWQLIDLIYNKELSVKENLQQINDEGIAIKKSTLYNYCHARNIKSKNLKYELFKEMHQEGMSIRAELSFLEDNRLKISLRTLHNYIRKYNNERSNLLYDVDPTQFNLDY